MRALGGCMLGDEWFGGREALFSQVNWHPHQRAGGDIRSPLPGEIQQEGTLKPWSWAFPSVELWEMTFSSHGDPTEPQPAGWCSWLRFRSEPSQLSQFQVHYFYLKFCTSCLRARILISCYKQKLPKKEAPSEAYQSFLQWWWVERLRCCGSTD